MPGPQGYRPSRRKFLRDAGLVVTGLGMVGVAGCADGSNGGGSASYEGDMAITHLETNLNAAAFHLATARKYFTDENLAVESVSFQGGTETIRGIIQADMNLGMPATIAVLQAQATVAPTLRIVGGMYNAASVVFLVPTDSKVNSIEDLRGRKVAFSSPGSITQYFGTRVPREQAGLVAGRDFELVSVGGGNDAWTAAKQGVVDVAWGTPPLTTSLIASGKAKQLFACSAHVPSWVDTPLVTTQPFIDENRDVLTAWMRALGRAIDVIVKDPRSAAEDIAKSYNVEATVMATALEESRSAWGLGLDRKGIAENVNALRELGQLKGEVSLDTVIVPDLIPGNG